MTRVIGEGVGDELDLALAVNQLRTDVEQGNVGMVLEHAADTDISLEELKQALSQALLNRANQRDQEAIKVVSSWDGWINAGKFEANRAAGLRRLAKLIENL